MGPRVMKLTAASTMLVAVLAFATQAHAVVFLDSDEFHTYCVDKYGDGAVGEGPSFDSSNRVSLNCNIAAANESHAEDVDMVCRELTGQVTWVNDRGRIVCIGQEAFGQNTGRGSFSSPN